MSLFSVVVVAQPPPPPFFANVPLFKKTNSTGPDADRCAALIEAHKVCLRAEGFQIE